MAATLQGWGGTSLLDSYDRERRPIHQRTMDEAASNYAVVGNELVRPGMEEEGPRGNAVRRAVGDVNRASKGREFSTLGLVLGSDCHGSPIVTPDGTAPPPGGAVHYVPSASPGCLAPHLWLLDGSSFYDHLALASPFLITTGDAAPAPVIEATAARLRIPLTILVPTESDCAGCIRLASSLSAQTST